jgi:hypothetical protein
MAPLSALLTIGCLAHGSTVNEMIPTLQFGTEVELRLRSGRSPDRISGELLAIGDTAALVLAQDVWIIALTDIAAIKPAATSLRTRSPSGSLTRPSEPSQFRLLSRFPQGMPAGALDRILAGRGQSAPRRPAAVATTRISQRKG